MTVSPDAGELTSPQTTISKLIQILDLSEPLSSEEQTHLLNQLQSAAEKIGNEIQNPRYRG